MEKWSELERKIRNSGETISPMFLANHFMERAGLPDTTKQSILTVVNLEKQETLLTQVKKAFETLVANFDKENKINDSLWGQNIHCERSKSPVRNEQEEERRRRKKTRDRERGRRRDDHDEMYEEYERRGSRRRKYSRNKSPIRNWKKKKGEDARKGKIEKADLETDSVPEDREGVITGGGEAGHGISKTQEPIL